jgi:hypothetical protein
VFSAALVTALVLAVPHGWHAVRANPSVRSTCDPVELIAVGSQAPRLGPEGWRAPRRGQVLVLVEVDHVNHPAGPLRRPAHFQVAWTHLQRLAGCCGTPAGRGVTFWFRQQGHLLGYVVVAGRNVPLARQRATERLLDSLRIR